MTKKIALNIFLLLSTYVVPLYFLYTFQDSAIKIGKIQTPALLILFLGAILLTYLNNMYRKQEVTYKWVMVVFEVSGVLGMLYSGLILAMIFLLKDCCGF